MRILVTNDDGIHSEGLDICAEIGRALSDDVWVIAPEFDQSGVSHSLSLNDPLRLREVAERRYAVKGTPTDCVIMGARHVIKDRQPGLVCQRNRGHARGRRSRSGSTVAGAVELAFSRVPSVAFMISGRAATSPDWSGGARGLTSSARARSPAFRARRADQRQFRLHDGVKGITSTNQGTTAGSRRSALDRTERRSYTGSPAAHKSLPPADGSDISRSPTTASRAARRCAST
jgi:hypothetical protein